MKRNKNCSLFYMYICLLCSLCFVKCKVDWSRLYIAVGHKNRTFLEVTEREISLFVRLRRRTCDRDMQMTQIYTGAIDTYSFRVYGAELTTTFERDETVTNGSLKKNRQVSAGQAAPFPRVINYLKLLCCRVCQRAPRYISYSYCEAR